jgi:hypothetical protein
MTHPNLTPMQKERINTDRRHLLRKINDPATNRMRERTAKEQLAAALKDQQRGPDDVIPDADDSAAWAGVMR